MSETNDTRKQSHVNLNTIIMGIVLAVVGWIGHETMQNGKTLAGMEAVSVERVLSNARVEKKVDTLSEDVGKQRDAIYEMRIKLEKLTTAK